MTLKTILSKITENRVKKFRYTEEILKNILNSRQDKDWNYLFDIINKNFLRCKEIDNKIKQVKTNIR